MSKSKKKRVESKQNPAKGQNPVKERSPAERKNRKPVSQRSTRPSTKAKGSDEESTVVAADMRPRTRYPWSQWLDGRTHKLQQGKHFQVSPKSFQVAAYQTVSRMVRAGTLAGSLTSRADGKLVEMQFHATSNGDN